MMMAKSLWPRKRLRELAEFRNGVNYNKNSFGFGIKVIGVSNFQDYSIPKYEELDQINPEGIITSRNILRDGDIVFVRSNGNRELIGRSLYIDNPPEDITHSAFTIRLRFTSNDVYPKFYSYLFKTKFIRQSLSAHGGGTNINNLNQDILNELEIPLPPFFVQKEITNILSAYDELIENNQRRIKILEEMARSLYREWFVYFRYPGHEKDRRVKSALGEIPEGWETNRIGSVFEIVLGGTPSRSNSAFWENGTIPWINSGKVNDLRIIEASELITEQALSKSAAKLMQKGTTVLAITGATLGQVSYLEIDTSANQSVVGISDKAGHMSEWIYLTIKERIQRIIKHASGGAQQHISKEIVSDVVISLPSKELNTKFKDVVNPIFREIAILLHANLNLKQTRDILLPRLMTGQVRLED